MKTATKVSQLIRLGSGALLLVLGLIIWTGHGDQLIGIHAMLGFLLVLPLWAIAAIAVRSGVVIGLEVGRDREGGTGFRVGPGHSCRSPAERSLSLAGQTGRAHDLKGPKAKGVYLMNATTDHKRSVVQRFYGVKRWMYRTGRPGALARVMNRISAVQFAAGVLSPARAVTLEVPGRRTGRLVSFPVVVAEYEGGRYLVSMLGKDANWVLNVRAAGGRAVLRRGAREEVRLEEVEPGDRAPILRRYLALAPGARPHLPVDRHAPLEEFEKIANLYPVFRIIPSAPSVKGGDDQTMRPVRGPLELSAHMTVRPGQLDGFKKQAAECIRLTRQKDTRTLRYDWFLSSDGTQCEVREAYTGAQGLIEHRANVAPALEALFEQYADNHTMTVYGQASRQLLDLAETHHMTGHITWFPFLDGLEPASRP